MTVNTFSPWWILHLSISTLLITNSLSSISTLFFKRLSWPGTMIWVGVALEGVDVTSETTPRHKLDGYCQNPNSDWTQTDLKKPFELCDPVHWLRRNSRCRERLRTVLQSTNQSWQQCQNISEHCHLKLNSGVAVPWNILWGLSCVMQLLSSVQGPFDLYLFYFLYNIYTSATLRWTVLPSVWSPLPFWLESPAQPPVWPPHWQGLHIPTGRSSLSGRIQW